MGAFPIIMKKTILPIAVLLLAATAALFAQSSRPAPDRDGPPPREGHRPPPPSPLMLALDVNHDGELSADEIANAASALRTLDQNGDGKLDRNELCPPPPDNFPPPGN